jgi:hypothetical protein
MVLRCPSHPLWRMLARDTGGWMKMNRPNLIVLDSRLRGNERRTPLRAALCELT